MLIKLIGRNIRHFRNYEGKSYSQRSIKRAQLELDTSSERSLIFAWNIAIKIPLHPKYRVNLDIDTRNVSSIDWRDAKS